MHLLLPAAALALLLLPCAPALAACPTVTEVNARYAAPWTEYLPMATLNERFRKAGDNTWLGSTMARLQAEVLFRPSQPNPDGCVPALLRIELSLAEHEVDLAKEIRNLPCVHKMVLEHEFKHVALNKVLLAEMQAWLRNSMGRRAQDMLDKVPPAEQTQVVRQFVAQDLPPVIEQRWKTLTARQKALDTAAEYRRIQSACPAELATLAAMAAELEKPAKKR